MYRTGGSPNVAGLVGLRTGCLDDQTMIKEAAPMVEVYVEKRPTWKPQIPGAVQLDGSYQQLDT